MQRREDDAQRLHRTPGIQPSPLALLAATCSRIGDTFHEETSIFTQKNLSYEKGKDDITLTKSCIDTRPNTLAAGLDRMFDVQQHSSPPFPPASITTSSPYFKVKQEENIDYDNCEGIHICPNVIAEARMLETQARASFGKSCSHDPPPPVCSHNPEPPSGNVSYNSPGCDHNASQGGHLSNSPTSCFYDSCSQSSSCAVDSGSFQGSVLAHLPFSGSTPSHNTNLDTYPRQKDYHSWPNQQTQFYRSNSYSSTEQKSSCMMRENYDNINSPLQNLHSSTPERSFRTSLSHMSYPSDNPLINLRSHTPSGSQTPHQYLQSTLATSSQPQSFPHPNFNTSPDVKPYSYQMHQQNVRQPMSPPCVTPPINYSQSQNMSPIHPPATPSLPPVNMSHHLHNHPAGMPSSFCSTCNSQANSMGLPTNPDGIPVNPMMNPELQAQSLTEYQYQQQQMFYARDNRRPRRIACTCPNCRDGENKTVTTKDGKQRKLHVCHIPGCGKIYGKTSHLRAHLRWHAGERPFACNWLFCNKRFTRSDELQRHRRTHTGDKRFECSICLKKFMRSDHLSKHMKTHQSHNKQAKDKTDANAAATDKTKQQTPATTPVVKIIKTTEEEAPKSTDTMGISESMKL